MNDWTVECTDSDGETDSFNLKKKGILVGLISIDSQGTLDFETYNGETLVLAAKDFGWIQSEVHRMWQLMNISSDREKPTRETFACAYCGEHIDHGEVKVRTDEGWFPYHPVCAPEPTQHTGFKIRGGC